MANLTKLFVFTPENQQFNLSDGSICFWLGDTGLGMAPVRRLRSQSPQQHGSTDMGFRLESRFFSVLLEIIGASMEDMQFKRTRLIRIFRPTTEPLKVRWELSLLGGDDEPIQRQIDCFYTGHMTFDSADRQGYSQRVAVELEAPDPVFYRPELLAFDIAPAQVGDVVDMDYVGTWREYPVITFKGPITDPVLRNLTTGHKLDFTGARLFTGWTMTVDLRFGKKTILDNSDPPLSAIHRLSQDSDLGTFHIATDIDAGGEQNQLRLDGSDVGIQDFVVRIEHHRRFMGW